MGRYLESPDRNQREETWRLTTGRRLKERDAFEGLFDRMLDLRVKAAGNAGFENFRDYMFRRKERFDYGPGDCEAFHESAEKIVKPLAARIQRKRAEKMGLASPRPWDLAVDPDGLPALKPFETAQRLAVGCEKILGEIDPEFGKTFRTMSALWLLDLESRKGKAPGGYNTTLSETRLPFIFTNVVGLDQDVRTLLHESGHAMHGFASRAIPFSPYRNAPTESARWLPWVWNSWPDPTSRVYPDRGDAARSSLRHLESVVALLPWIAAVDAFQHWIYTHPHHPRKERTDAWTGMMERFGGIEDWTGLEKIQPTAGTVNCTYSNYPFITSSTASPN